MAKDRDRRQIDPPPSGGGSMQDQLVKIGLVPPIPNPPQPPVNISAKRGQPQGGDTMRQSGQQKKRGASCIDLSSSPVKECLARGRQKME